MCTLTIQYCTALESPKSNVSLYWLSWWCGVRESLATITTIAQIQFHGELLFFLPAVIFGQISHNIYSYLSDSFTFYNFLCTLTLSQLLISVRAVYTGPSSTASKCQLLPIVFLITTSHVCNNQTKSHRLLYSALWCVCHKEGRWEIHEASKRSSVIVRWQLGWRLPTYCLFVDPYMCGLCSSHCVCRMSEWVL